MRWYNVVLPVVGELFLLYCGAFFAATETAYTGISRIQVKTMVKTGARNAKLVSRLRNNLERLISTVLIGTNLVTTFATALATAFAIEVFGPSYVTYATAVMSVLVIIFMEIVPKTYAAARSESTASNAAPVILLIQKVFFIIIWFFDQFTKGLNFVEKKLVRDNTPLVTEEELKTLIDLGGKEGTLEEDEKKMLERIFEFSDLKAGDVMKHRSLVKYIDVCSSIDEVVKAFSVGGYSRMPVYEGTPENIIGVLHYKAVLFAPDEITACRGFVRECMREPLFVPESLTMVELLRLYKKNRVNFAMTVDEYGSTSGIVTVTDVLREVFGRMTDEYGCAAVAPEKRIDVVGTNEFIVPGDLKIDDFNDVLNTNLDSDNYDTLGGWLLERFGELPSIGAIYKNNGIMFTVEDQSARRIQTVRIRFLRR